jgi:hypothetical protein
VQGLQSVQQVTQGFLLVVAKQYTIVNFDANGNVECLILFLATPKSPKSLEHMDISLSGNVGEHLHR